MAWTYSDYETQATDELRLARARLFKSELINAIGPSVSADGKSRDSGQINTLLNRVDADIRRLEAAVPGGSTAPAIGVVDFRRGV